MRIFQRLRTKKAQDKGKEITEAVRAYNEALSALGEAAGTIGRVAKENGMSTEKNRNLRGKNAGNRPDSPNLPGRLNERRKQPWERTKELIFNQSSRQL